MLELGEARLQVGLVRLALQSVRHGLLVGLEEQGGLMVCLGDRLGHKVKLQVLQLLPELGLAFEDVFERLLHLGEACAEFQLRRHA